MNYDELKHQLLLMNYNNKKTLTENINDILVEHGVIKDLVSTGSIVAKELEGVLKTMMKDTKVTTALKDVELYKGGMKTGVRTAEELVTAIKLNKLSSTLKGELELAILQSKTTNRVLVDAAASNLVRNKQFISKYSEEIRQGQSQFEAALKRAGYSDEAITSIVKQTESLGGKIKNAEDIVKSSGGKIKNAEDVVKSSGGVSKTTTLTKETEALAKESHISKYKETFKKYYNNGKGRISELKKSDWVKKGFLKKTGGLGRPIKWVISKRKALAWAAAAGVAYLIWKSWANGQDIVVEGDDKTDETKTGGSTYTNCSNYPYKKGCISPIIAEVQKCLGITDDGKFGPNTESTLISKGYGKEITKEVYDKIISNCGGTTDPTTTTTTTLNPANDYTLMDVDASDASQLFK